MLSKDKKSPKPSPNKILRKTQKQQVIAEVAIGIGSNKVEQLIIYKNDNIEEKVKNFVKKHKLTVKANSAIISEVENQIKKNRENKSYSPFPHKPNLVTNTKPQCEFNAITRKFFHTPTSKNGIKINSKVRNSNLRTRSKSPMREDEIYKIKLVKYKYMFDQLDSDRDGKISTQKINLCVLDFEILEAMTPILKELQKSQKLMDFKEFCILADKCLAIKILDED